MKTKQKIIGSVVILVILIAFLVVGLVINKPKSHKLDEDDIFVETTYSENESKAETKMLTVCIKGEVKNPGVYKLKSGSIVDDLVKSAGGFTEVADKDNKLNLARKLKDEDFIYVDKKIDEGSQAVQANTKAASSNNQEDEKIDLNSATLEELDKLPGIGPTTAQKIIDYREKNGVYTSIEDLKKLGGIGDKTIDKFRDKVDIR